MEPKDEFDAFMKLAEFHRTIRENRYQAILRISLSLWAVMAAAAIYLKHRPPEALFDVILIMIVVFHSLAVRYTQLRIWTDMTCAFYYLECARKIVLPDTVVRPMPISVADLSLRQQWQGRSLIGMPIWTAPTVALCLVAYFIIGSSN
jgi:hypothetical protein